MLGGWRKEKDTSLTDVKRKRACCKEYDAINRMRQKEREKKKERKKKGEKKMGEGKSGKKREETEL